MPLEPPHSPNPPAVIVSDETVVAQPQEQPTLPQEASGAPVEIFNDQDDRIDIFKDYEFPPYDWNPDGYT